MYLEISYKYFNTECQTSHLMFQFCLRIHKLLNQLNELHTFPSLCLVISMLPPYTKNSFISPLLLICAVLPSSAHSDPFSQRLEQHNSKRKLILKTIAKIHMAHYLIINKISLTYPDNKLCRTNIVPFPPHPHHCYGPSSLSSSNICIARLT